MYGRKDWEGMMTEEKISQILDGIDYSFEQERSLRTLNKIYGSGHLFLHLKAKNGRILKTQCLCSTYSQNDLVEKPIPPIEILKEMLRENLKAEIERVLTKRSGFKGERGYFKIIDMEISKTVI